MLWFTGLQRVGHNWATELNINKIQFRFIFNIYILLNETEWFEVVHTHMHVYTYKIYLIVGLWVIKWEISGLHRRFHGIYAFVLLGVHSFICLAPKWFFSSKGIKVHVISIFFYYYKNVHCRIMQKLIM